MDISVVDHPRQMLRSVRSSDFDSSVRIVRFIELQAGRQSRPAKAWGCPRRRPEDSENGLHLSPGQTGDSGGPSGRTRIPEAADRGL